MEPSTALAAGQVEADAAGGRVLELVAVKEQSHGSTVGHVCALNRVAQLGLAKSSRIVPSVGHTSCFPCKRDASKPPHVAGA